MEKTNLQASALEYKQKKRLRLGTADWVALFVFVAVALFLILIAPYGITEIDDAVYQTIPQRVNRGDKLAADEWLVCFFSTYFWYLPYKFFHAVLGGTQGLLLCLRYLHCAVKLFFFGVVYTGFRKYQYWAILAAVIYVGFDPFGIKSQNYYSFCFNALLLTGMLLFVKREPKPRHYFAAGITLSCAVLAEPSVCLLWFLYTAAVAVRQVRKKRGTLPSGAGGVLPDARAWRQMAAGILTAVVLFLLFGIFFFGTDLKLIFTGFRQIFTDSEYTPTGDLLKTLRLEKALEFLKLYDPVGIALFFIVLVAGLALHRFTRRFDFPVFLTLCGFYAALSAILLLQPLRNNSFAYGQCVSHPLLLAVMGIPAYVFTKEKNRRLFAFLLFSFLASLCVDVVSDCAFGSILLPGDVCAVILLCEYLREATAAKKAKAATGEKGAAEKTEARAARKRRRPDLRGLSAVLIVAVVIAVEAANYGYSAWLHETEYLYCRSDEPLDQTISVGVYKGIKTIGRVRDDYEACFADMARVRELCRTGFYIPSVAPALYLDADVNISTGSAFPYEIDYWRRTELWWALHPDKKPDVIYIPYKDLSYFNPSDPPMEEKLDHLRSLADITVEAGVGGNIVRIVRWR